MFKGFYISIIGIIFLLIITLFIFPEGEINKFLKSAFSIFLFICLLFPIINIFKDDFSFSINNQNFTYIDHEFTQNFQSRVIQKNAKCIEDFAKNKYNCNILLKYSTKIVDNKVKVEKVYVDLTNSGITENEVHIKIVQEIIQLCVDTFNIKEDQVKIDEG